MKTVLMTDQTKTSHAWNPGLQSDIPKQLWPLVTLFREEHAFVSYAEAKELADLTGMKVLELVSLKPARLVAHALLVRVTADLSVPDGPNYEELGLNLRGMVKKIHTQYMQPEMELITATWEAERNKAETLVSEQMIRGLAQPQSNSANVVEKPSLLNRLFGRKPEPKRTVLEEETQEIRAINQWKLQLDNSESALERACLESLIKTVDSMVANRGRLLPDHALITRLVVNQVSNTHGADVIDKVIDQLWPRAIETECYRVLPPQPSPVIMNVKGASASGKSTIRPQQRQLAETLGIPWEDFALISPDYWRKYLLDYSSLGEDYKYGAMLTGRELEIIDKKLDRYMAEKAKRCAMSHLLIDRFRFDSFAVDVSQGESSKLLSRFGDKIYLFFMVTHPAETVVRAWSRGIKTGRYKAVDDLLYHNVEAFTGMPALFLSWVNSKDKQIHFEFLDNDVELGTLPKTAAFGWNNTLTILDVRLLVNINRYRNVNITAREPEEIFTPDNLNPASNTDFIVRCAQRVQRIQFADQQSAQIYAVVDDGKLIWWDDEYIQQHSAMDGLIETLQALGYVGGLCTGESCDIPAIDILTEKHSTVGEWGLEGG